jgi:hypothetical protein
MGIRAMKEHGHYAQAGDGTALLYVMGFLRDHAGADTLVCDLFVWDVGRLDYVHSIQGTGRIDPGEWREVTADEYRRLRDERKAAVADIAAGAAKLIELDTGRRLGR